jgi:hypothetical protein
MPTSSKLILKYKEKKLILIFGFLSMDENEGWISTKRTNDFDLSQIKKKQKIDG